MQNTMETVTIQYALIFGIGVIGYFLKNLMNKFNKMEDEVQNLKVEVEVSKSNQANLNEKFGQIYELMKELSTEVRNISIQLSKKKDRE